MAWIDPEAPAGVLVDVHAVLAGCGGLDPGLVVVHGQARVRVPRCAPDLRAFVDLEALPSRLAAYALNVSQSGNAIMKSDT